METEVALEEIGEEPERVERDMASTQRYSWDCAVRYGDGHCHRRCKGLGKVCSWDADGSIEEQ